jgi:hypothetical protein
VSSAAQRQRGARGLATTQATLTEHDLRTLDAASRLPAECPGSMLERQGEYRCNPLREARREA